MARRKSKKSAEAGPSGVAQFILSRRPQIAESLTKAYPLQMPEQYLSRNLILTLIFGGVFGVLMTVLLVSARKFALGRAVVGGIAIGLMVWLLLFLLFVLIFPGVKAGKRAEQIEKHLLFALRELRLLVRAGYPSYDAVVHLASAGYGELSSEFEALVRDLEANVSLKQAMASARARNPSKAFARTLSILNSAFKSGSSLRKELDAAIRSLDAEQKAAIRSYAKELNLWTLLYMLFAVAIPTIGAVLVLVLSAFVGGGMGTSSYVLLIISCFIIQATLIGFVKSRRPIGV